MNKDYTIHKYEPEKEYFFHEGCFINEFSNSPEDNDVSIARARVAPGAITKWHTLRATTERYVILEGEGRVDLGESKESYQVSPGDVIVIPPACPQRICNTGDNDLIFLVICSPRFLVSAYKQLDL